MHASSRLKSFYIELQSQRTSASHSYCPGDSLCGIIVVEPHAKQLVAKLKIGIFGTAKVFSRFSMHSESARKPDLQAQSCADTSNVIQYFNSEKYVFESRRASAPSGQYSLVCAMGITGREEFPFVFRLPDRGFPPSWKGLYGTIQYWIEATAEVGGREFFTEKVTHAVDMLPAPKLFGTNPKPYHKILQLPSLSCSGRSFVSVKIQFDKTAYLPGEPLSLSVSIKNTSPWIIKPVARLVRIETYATTKRETVQRIKEPMFNASGVPVKPHTDVQWTLPIWNIPLTTPISLMDCANIRNQYFIVVRLRLSRLLIPATYEVSQSVLMVYATILPDPVNHPATPVPLDDQETVLSGSRFRHLSSVLEAESRCDSAVPPCETDDQLSLQVLSSEEGPSNIIRMTNQSTDVDAKDINVKVAEDGPLRIRSHLRGNFLTVLSEEYSNR